MMKISVLIVLLFLAGCFVKNKATLEDVFTFSEAQYQALFLKLDSAITNESEKSIKLRQRRKQQPLVSPRTVRDDGTLVAVPSDDWTSGFFPGALWYIYEYTQYTYWKNRAEELTKKMENGQWNGETHDIGFKIFCSYGNGYRLTQSKEYKKVLLQAAKTLTTRYKPIVGAISSWNHNTDKWDFPVIIDNMMNLELLFWATRISSDSTYYKIAETHALTTHNNHFRDDYSSYHVVGYDTITGNATQHNTHQGWSDESAWSRGQAWALYGYTMCYSETNNKLFLECAKSVSEFIFSHPNMPSDLVPYWDFDDPNILNAPRDVSAATIIASALYELSKHVPDRSDDYVAMANEVLRSLTDNYLSKPLHNSFILNHSTGHFSRNLEIDALIIYADYYFLEALLRKKDGDCE